MQSPNNYGSRIAAANFFPPSCTFADFSSTRRGGFPSDAVIMLNHTVINNSNKVEEKFEQPQGIAPSRSRTIRVVEVLQEVVVEEENW